MKMLKEEDLNCDTHPLHFRKNCYDITMIDNYGCGHYKYNDILIFSHDEQELNDLNDIFPLNKSSPNLEQKSIMSIEL